MYAPAAIRVLRISTAVAGCRPDQIAGYQSRISGPFLDCIDLYVGVPRMDFAQSREAPSGELSDMVRRRVIETDQLQKQQQGCNNARSSGEQLDRYCRLTASDTRLLDQVSRKFHLSRRAHHRLLRVARTAADLEQCDEIQSRHLMEAIAYLQVAYAQ